MAAVLSFFLILALSILLTRIATVALTLTGLSRQTARFQSRSAFTGVGFTTSETEKAVNQPLRRRIILLLMLLGNAGIVTAITSLVISLTGGDTINRLIVLVLGISILWTAATSDWLDRHLSRIIGRVLHKFTKLDLADYARLLHLSGKYGISEWLVEEGDWAANQTLSESKLREEGLLVLGVERKDHTYLGAPNGSTKVVPGDTLILYGRQNDLQELARRKKGASGNIEHNEAIARRKKVVADEKREDPELDKNSKE